MAGSTRTATETRPRKSCSRPPTTRAPRFDAGITTLQSPGSPEDAELRDRIAAGVVVGPRILTSLEPLNEKSGTPEELRAIVRKATAADPGRRYPSAASLASDVRRHLRGEAVEARPDGLATRVARTLARHRFATLAGLCGTVLVGALAVMAVLYHREQGIAAAHAREERTAALLASAAARFLHRRPALLSMLMGVIGDFVPPRELLRAMRG